MNRRYSTTMIRPVLLAGRLADRDPLTMLGEPANIGSAVQISEMNYDSM